MDSLYFTAMIIGIAWLALWTAMPEGLPFASPFDVQPDGAASPKTEPDVAAKRPVASRGSDATAPRPASARTNAAASWRKRMRPRRVETAAAEASSGQPERRPVASWRTRRELPAGSRRRH